MTDGTYGYFMRVQKIESYEERIKTLADDPDYTRVFCVEHRGEKRDPNPHYHIIIGTTVKDKAFWKRMTTKFDLGKGNEHASHKRWDGHIEACAYMFHEDDNANVIVNKGFSDNDIARMKAINAEVKQRANDAANGSHTEKQLAKHNLTMWDIVEIVRKQMRVHEDPTGSRWFVGDMMVSGDTEYPEESAYKKLIDVLEKYKIRSAEHEIKRWMDTILRIDPTFDAVKRNILHRYRG